MTACSSDRSEEHALSAPKPGRSEEHALPRPPSVRPPPGAEWPTETRGFTVLFISGGALPKLSISQEIDSFGGTCDGNRGCLVLASRGRITPSASDADVVMLTMPPLPLPEQSGQVTAPPPMTQASHDHASRGRITPSASDRAESALVGLECTTRLRSFPEDRRARIRRARHYH